MVGHRGNKGRERMRRKKIRTFGEGRGKARGGEKIEEGGRETMGRQAVTAIRERERSSSAAVFPPSSSQHVKKD